MSTRRLSSMRRAVCILTVSLSCSLALCICGCSFSKYGNADVTAFDIKMPEGLVGLDKSAIIDKLGLPDGAIADEKGAEYWAYNNTNRYYIILFGKGGHKTLILRLEDNVVTAARLVTKGSSIGFLAG